MKVFEIKMFLKKKKKKTRARLYTTIISPTLNYGLEPWTTPLAMQGGRPRVEHGEHYCGLIAAERKCREESRNRVRGEED